MYFNKEKIIADGHSDLYRYRGPNLAKCRRNIKRDDIPKKTVQKAFNAWDFASYIDHPINIFVVIHLRDGVDQSAMTAFSKIREKYNGWLRRKTNDEKKCSPIYVYSFENPANNMHVNWCIHVPEHLIESFSTILPQWVESVEGDLTDETVYIDKM